MLFKGAIRWEYGYTCTLLYNINCSVHENDISWTSLFPHPHVNTVRVKSCWKNSPTRTTDSQQYFLLLILRWFKLALYLRHTVYVAVILKKWKALRKSTAGEQFSAASNSSVQCVRMQNVGNMEYRCIQCHPKEE